MKIHYGKKPIKAARNPKTVVELILQGNYGYGWDDLVTYDDTPEGRKECKVDLKAYRENERIPLRTIRRRVPNPNYVAPDVEASCGKKSVKSSTGNKPHSKIMARYSDAVPYEDRKYWYFTTHGIGPGMLPKGVNILDTQEGQNRKGTWGEYILLDAVLDTDELRYYDLVELAPKSVEDERLARSGRTSDWDNYIFLDDVESSCSRKSVKAGYQLQFPYMVEGEFADGYTYTAGGNSEAECVETLANMQDKHGELVWYSGITDEDYDAGRRIDSACSRKSVKSAHYKAKPGGWNYDNPETNKFWFLYKHRWHTGYKTFDECLADVIDTVGIDNIISEGVEISKENSAGYSIERWDPSEVYEEARGIVSGGVTASTGNKHRSKIMAGPGAGYTIKWTLDKIDNVNSFNVVNVSRMDSYGTVTVTADCDVDVTVTIDSAWSYSYGFSDPIENVPAKITRIIFDMYTPDWSFLDPNDYENGEDDEAYQEAIEAAIYALTEADAIKVLEDEAWETIKGDEYIYGGGYTHSTYDGTLNEIDGDYNWVDIKITDEAIINYIDQSVTGDNRSTNYVLINYDEEIIDAFDNLEDAEAVANDLVSTGAEDYIEIWEEEDVMGPTGEFNLDSSNSTFITRVSRDSEYDEELPWE